jgi:acyl-coenzyme A synthetase/AMP-(fatty) acid ligase
MYDPAPDTLAWWRPDEAPADLNGPVDVRFEPPPWATLDRPVFELLEAVADRWPDAVALRDDARTLRYGELRQAARRLAVRVAAATRSGSAVAVWLANGCDAVVAMLACFAAARTCLMLNADFPADRVSVILRQAAAAGVILANPASIPSLPEHVVPIVPHAAEQRDDAPDSAVACFDPVGPDDPALVIYTSGSSGQPKGIVRSHRQTVYLGWKKVHRFHLQPADRVMTPFAVTSGPGVVTLMMTLIAGASLYPVHVAASGARAVLETAQAEQITLLTGLPALLRLLLALDGAAAAFRTLRAVYTTSESLLRADIDAWRGVLPDDCKVALVYGMSEGAPLTEWFVPRKLPDGAARLPVGYPNADLEFAMTDAQGRSAAAGDTGALWVRSNLLSLGEWQDGRCVPGRLLCDPHDPSRVVLPTGDLLCRRPDGLMDFIGRTDAQVKVRGNRIDPAEVEEVLRRAPGVTDAAVLARRIGDDNALIAFVVASREPGPALRRALAQRMRATLPAYMMPARLHFIECLPRLASNKLDTSALAARDDAPGPAPGLLSRLGFSFRRSSG